MSEVKTEIIDCPYCGSSKNVFWAEENGFNAVKCEDCGLIFVNPRPIFSLIDKAVKTGVHNEVSHGRTVISRRIESKVKHYNEVLGKIFADVWATRDKISWLDVGAGYGELIEAVTELAPSDSRVEGIEPMTPKANHAKARGLLVRECYLKEIESKFDFLSLANVFSHIPDFRLFLKDVRKILNSGGELFIETGNAGDLNRISQVSGNLNLPDHLVFAGEKHIVGYLSEAGFTIIEIQKIRTDGLVNFGKNIIKKIIGRKINLLLPYSSPLRSMRIRAKLV